MEISHLIPHKLLPVYSGEIISPRKRKLKHPDFNQELAQFYKALGLSGDDTIDWILEQIYDGSDGPLIDFNGYEIKRSEWMVHEEFGDEGRRWINTYKLFANHKSKQRLQEKCVMRVMAMSFAKDIYLERVKLYMDKNA